jgi:four helix bundle protein
MEKKPAQQLGFESLVSYQFSLKLYKASYQISANFPIHERLNLAPQLRRAATSVLLNIAEGYGRFHHLEKLRFFYIARGSLNEMLSAFNCAHQAGYLDEEQLTNHREIHSQAEKSLNGYIRFIRKQKQGQDEFGSKLIRDEDTAYLTSDTSDDSTDLDETPDIAP